MTTTESIRNAVRQALLDRTKEGIREAILSASKRMTVIFKDLEIYESTADIMKKSLQFYNEYLESKDLRKLLESLKWLRSFNSYHQCYRCPLKTCGLRLMSGILFQMENIEISMLNYPDTEKVAKSIKTLLEDFIEQFDILTNTYHEVIDSFPKEEIEAKLAFAVGKTLNEPPQTQQQPKCSNNSEDDAQKSDPKIDNHEPSMYA